VPHIEFSLYKNSVNGRLFAMVNNYVIVFYVLYAYHISTDIITHVFLFLYSLLLYCSTVCDCHAFNKCNLLACLPTNSVKALKGQRQPSDRRRRQQQQKYYYLTITTTIDRTSPCVRSR